MALNEINELFKSTCWEVHVPQKNQDYSAPSRNKSFDLSSDKKYFDSLQAIKHGFDSIFDNHLLNESRWTHQLDDLTFQFNRLRRPSDESQAKFVFFNQLIDSIYHDLQYLVSPSDADTFKTVISVEHRVAEKPGICGKKPVVDYLVRGIKGHRDPAFLIPIEAKYQMSALHARQLADYLSRLSYLMGNKAVIGVLLDISYYRLAFSVFSDWSSKKHLPIVLTSPSIHYHELLRHGNYLIPHTTCLLTILPLLSIERVPMMCDDFQEYIRNLEEDPAQLEAGDETSAVIQRLEEKFQNKIKGQEKKIKDQEKKIEDQEKKIEDQEKKIEEFEKKIQVLEEKTFTN